MAKMRKVQITILNLIASMVLNQLMVTQRFSLTLYTSALFAITTITIALGILFCGKDVSTVHRGVISKSEIGT